MRVDGRVGGPFSPDNVSPCLPHLTSALAPVDDPRPIPIPQTICRHPYATTRPATIRTRIPVETERLFSRSLIRTGVAVPTASTAFHLSEIDRRLCGRGRAGSYLTSAMPLLVHHVRPWGLPGVLH